jgi:hypothetical protein
MESLVRLLDGVARRVAERLTPASPNPHPDAPKCFSRLRFDGRVYEVGANQLGNRIEIWHIWDRQGFQSLPLSQLRVLYVETYGYVVEPDVRSKRGMRRRARQYIKLWSEQVQSDQIAAPPKH